MDCSRFFLDTYKLEIRTISESFRLFSMGNHVVLFKMTLSFYRDLASLENGASLDELIKRFKLVEHQNGKGKNLFTVKIAKTFALFIRYWLKTSWRDFSWNTQTEQA